MLLQDAPIFASAQARASPHRYKGMFPNLRNGGEPPRLAIVASVAAAIGIPMWLSATASSERRRRSSSPGCFQEGRTSPSLAIGDGRGFRSASLPRSELRTHVRFRWDMRKIVGLGCRQDIDGRFFARCPNCGSGPFQRYLRLFAALHLPDNRVSFHRQHVEAGHGRLSEPYEL